MRGEVCKRRAREDERRRRLIDHAAVRNVNDKGLLVAGQAESPVTSREGRLEHVSVRKHAVASDGDERVCSDGCWNHLQRIESAAEKRVLFRGCIDFNCCTRRNRSAASIADRTIKRERAAANEPHPAANG